MNQFCETDEDLYSDEDESDKDWSSKKEEMNQFHHVTIADKGIGIYHKEEDILQELVSKEDESDSNLPSSKKHNNLSSKRGGASEEGEKNI